MAQEAVLCRWGLSWSGNVYRGEWKDDVKHGRGTLPGSLLEERNGGTQCVSNQIGW